jgi:hypothetical protein
MKNLFIPVLLLCSLNLSAQTSRSTSKSITNDGNTLKLKYEVTGTGKNISYNSEFEVGGWSKEQKELLVKHIVDSLENTAGDANVFMNRKVSDDGENMTVSVEGTKNGKPFSYNKAFNVKGMSQKQKHAAVEEFMKSVGLKD